MAKVTRKEQEENGLIRVGGKSFVPPQKKEESSIPAPFDFGKNAGNSNIDTQIKTSKVDDAQAFLMKTWQISAVIGFTVFVIGWAAGANAAIAAIAALLIFAVLQIIMHWQHLVFSPENIARYNAKRHWRNVDKVYDAYIQKFKKDHGLD